MPYAAVLAAALALTACSSGDPKPPQTAGPTSAVTSLSVPSTTATTTSATPTTVEDPVLAKIPKAARARTEQGAEAFVAFFMESLNTAATKADPKVLQGLYDKGCKTCQSMQASIVELRDKGERYAKPSLTVRESKVLVFSEEQKVVRVAFSEEQVDVLDATGRKVDYVKPDEAVFAATVAFRDGHWVMLKLQVFG